MQTKQELENKLCELKHYLLAQPLNGTIKELVRKQEILLQNHITSTHTIPVSKTPVSKTPVNKLEKETKPIKNTSAIDKKRKKAIPSTIKRLVWNTNIGEHIGKAKCVCCNSTDITQMSFNCGHIIAESNGGNLVVSNLKPICQNCNSSMGTQNMNEFMLSLK